MAIADFYVLQDTLLMFENTLRIEYDEHECSAILTKAKRALENAYQVRLDASVYTVQAQNALVSDNLNMFLQQLSECIKSMCAYTHTVMFSKNCPISLAEVNHLGYTGESLRTALKYLQDSVLYEKRSSFLPAIRAALDNIDMCPLKRLFVIMLMLEDLGIPEGVSCVAQLLYVGGLKL